LKAGPRSSTGVVAGGSSRVRAAPVSWRTWPRHFVHLGREAHVVREATSRAVGPVDHVVAPSSSEDTAVTFPLARLVLDGGADLLGVMAKPLESIPAGLSNVRLIVPEGDSRRFVGSLREQ
jgi:D-arabinose 5-phosphate isomerase GutQ